MHQVLWRIWDFTEAVPASGTNLMVPKGQLRFNGRNWIVHFNVWIIFLSHLCFLLRIFMDFWNDFRIILATLGHFFLFKTCEKQLASRPMRRFIDRGPGRRPVCPLWPKQKNPRPLALTRTFLNSRGSLKSGQLLGGGWTNRFITYVVDNGVSDFV